MNSRAQEHIFKQWLEEHEGLIVKVALGFCSNEEDRNDLTQEILVQLWHTIPRFKGDCKPSTWIYRVAFNKALMWKRGERRHRDGERILLSAAEEDGSLSHTGNPVTDNERVRALYRAIHALNPVDRSLMLMQLDGLSYRDMSEVLGISETNVGARISRAKRQLLELLEEKP